MLEGVEKVQSDRSMIEDQRVHVNMLPGYDRFPREGARGTSPKTGICSTWRARRGADAIIEIFHQEGSDMAMIKPTSTNTSSSAGLFDDEPATNTGLVGALTTVAEARLR